MPLHFGKEIRWPRLSAQRQGSHPALFLFSNTEKIASTFTRRVPPNRFFSRPPFPPRWFFRRNSPSAWYVPPFFFHLRAGLSFFSRGPPPFVKARFRPSLHALATRARLFLVRAPRPSSSESAPPPSECGKTVTPSDPLPKPSGGPPFRTPAVLDPNPFSSRVLGPSRPPFPSNPGPTQHVEK